MLPFIEKARSLGFAAVGFAKPTRPVHFEHFSAWLAAGKNAGMAWLSRNLEVREDPSKLLEGCATLLCLAYPYPARKPQTEDGFSVARYANPAKEDYHTLLKSLCSELVFLIQESCPGAKSRICIDSAPLLEKDLAAAAGLGFIGKNTLLILPGYGSYVYLAEIVTTAEIPAPAPEPVISRCGTCSLCMDACPTGALEEPFHLNASRCLSYLTVEDPGPLGDGSSNHMGRCIFGCDRCQEVCPWNKGSDRAEVILPATRDLLNLEEKTFLERYGKTALARRGLDKLKSNIRAARRGT